ncbi:type II toxin-antitoxin system HigB family toxin [Burkholderia sp. R-70211]|nr:type II toxin-antitoxin system HigB family toxin [Burkholderia sp. R-70211]
MRLLGRNLLQRLYGQDSRTDRWLISWTAEICNANWKRADDVLRQFPLATYGEPNFFVFRVGGGGCGVKLSIMFPLGIAVVSDLELDTDIL